MTIYGAAFCTPLSLRTPAAAMHDLKAHGAIKRGDTLQLSKQSANKRQKGCKKL
jgi:hypothetical protein